MRGLPQNHKYWNELLVGQATLPCHSFPAVDADILVCIRVDHVVSVLLKNLFPTQLMLRVQHGMFCAGR